MSKEARLQQLTTELQQAAKAYYTENREIMSNKEDRCKVIRSEGIWR